MLFRRVKQTDPERIFVIVKNSYDTADMTSGQAVIWAFESDVDGLGVTIPTAIVTNQGIAAAGIVAESIASGEYGLIQVYGYHSSVRARVATSAELIVGGTALALNAAGSVFCLESFVSSTVTSKPLRYPCAFALEAYSSWTTKAIKAFIKCL